MKQNSKQTVTRCIGLGAKLMPRHFTGMVFVHLFLAILPVIGIQISRRIYQFAEHTVFGTQPVAELLLPVVLYGVYLFLMKGYTIYYERVAVQFGGLLEFEKKTKLLLHEKCGKIAMSYYETPSFYNRLWEAKVASINVYRVVECVITLSGAALSIMLLSGYAATIHLIFFLLIVLTAVPALLENVSEGILKNRRRTLLASLAKEEKERRACVLDIRYAKERLVYESSGFLINKWKDSSNTLQEKEYEVEKQVLKIRTLLMLVRASATAGVYVLAGWLFFHGSIDYAEFMVAISTTRQLQNQYAQLFADLGYFSQFRMMVKPFFLFMDSEDEIRCSEMTGKIAFDHAGFTYPTGKEAVLHNLDFTIHAGEKVAVVGVNGAGKTTLSKLLTGLLSVTEGRAEGKISDAFSVMFQEHQRYELTLLENIAPQELELADKKLAEELLREMNLDQVPKNEILGREFGITDLSGGQWQKLAMARTFYHGGNFFVLDEPTSAIDPLYEKELNDFIFRQAGKENTLVVISHRLSIAKAADRVFVLDHGTIVEQGTHEELLETPDSLYQKLWKAQLSWYEYKDNSAMYIERLT